MTTPYERALKIAITLLQETERIGPPAREQIAESVDEVLSMRRHSWAGVEREMLIKDLESRFQVHVGNATILSDVTGHKPWLETKRGEVQWRYWDRYQAWMEGRIPPASIRKLDELTNQILSLLEDPRRTGSWDRRGLVMGHVQSGKTSNYTGLICKAADAGYKVIIVLAGMHKNLRSQTQMRLDEGFLGYESMPPAEESARALKIIGVGQVDASLRTDTITNRSDEGDFSRAVARNFNINPGGNPLLFVVKKNARVLSNLVDWVRWAAQSTDESGRRFVANVPLLMIDDEADHGSVDTKDGAIDELGRPDEDHDPTRLNQLIRQLLNCFDQSAYVGYTATPFANIFIHEQGRTREEGEDLFPRSFIINLPVPSNYIGPVKVFGLEADVELDVERTPGLPLVRHITDHAASLNVDERVGWMPPRHKNGWTPLYNGHREIPPSLRRAIMSFVLATAARRARGDTHVHNSMLIHVTRYTTVQHEVTEQVREELYTMTNRLRLGEGAVEDTLLDRFKTLWNEDFIPTTLRMQGESPELSSISWEEIQPHLLHVVSAIHVREINGSAKDVLDYELNRENGFTVIAVGGDKLARGLTLEGLSVSYFLRTTRMYDTLMQMGRWFGYRPGYLDLCRLYMTSELQDWFEYITAASEELRREFDHMVATGGTPADYGLKVCSHPVLLVTSPVKMRHGVELQLSYQGTLAETTLFHRHAEIRLKNFAAFLQLVAALEDPTERNPVRDRPEERRHTWEGGRLWSNVPASLVRAFLSEVETHRDAYRVNGKLLARFIELQEQAGAVQNWTVAIFAGDAEQGRDWDGVRFVRRQEKRDTIPPGDQRYVIQRLLSPKDEAIDLDLDSFNTALEQARKVARLEGKEKLPELPSGPQIRAQRPRTNGLMMLYLIDPKSGGLDDVLRNDGGTGFVPIIGFGVSFPGDLPDRKIEYTVNNVYWRQEFGDLQ